MLFDLDVATWTALGTWALVVGTLVLMYWQTRQNQRLNSANAVMSLRERFDAPRMLKARKHLSERLLHGQHEEITNVEVATFFELVGALAHHKVLDQELVWEGFGSWISTYYWALRHPVDMIGRARLDLKDPLVFHEFEWVYHRILAIDKRMNPASTAPDSAESAINGRQLLEIESEIEVD